MKSWHPFFMHRAYPRCVMRWAARDLLRVSCSLYHCSFNLLRQPIEFRLEREIVVVFTRHEDRLSIRKQTREKGLGTMKWSQREKSCFAEQAKAKGRVRSSAAVRNRCFILAALMKSIGSFV